MWFICIIYEVGIIFVVVFLNNWNDEGFVFNLILVVENLFYNVNSINDSL